MRARDVLGSVGDLGQLVLGAGLLGPALRRLEASRPGMRDTIRHEAHGARGEAFVEHASLVEKAAFVAKILGTDGARFRPAAEPPIRSKVDDELLVAGDLLFPGALGGATLSDALRERIGQARAIVINLEGTLGEEPQELAPLQTVRGVRQLLRYSQDAASPGWASRIGREGLARLLEGLPSPVLSVANNHTLDDGLEGFERTVSLARSLGAAVVGDARQGRGAVVIPVGAHRAGLVALSYGHNRRRVGAGLHLAFARVPYALDRTLLEELASDLRARGATHRVALLHWGHEHEHEPTDEQRRCVDALFTAGFSAVVGHHPHLLQTSDCAGGRAVFYSLGDFIGGDRTIWSRLGALASLGLRPGGRVSASLVPIAQTPYWRSPRTSRLEEAPPLERAAFAAFFRWKHRDHQESP